MARTIGVVIGRFQVDELTDGHLALIEHVKRNSNDVCILHGTSKERNLKNPLPWECVSQMLRTTFPDIFYIHPLLDVPGDNRKWSDTVDQFLDLLFPDCEIKLYGGRDCFKKDYVGKHQPVVEFPDFDKSETGTRVRSRIISSHPEDHPAFRRGIIYARGNDVQAQSTTGNGQLQSIPLEASPTGYDPHL